MRTWLARLALALAPLTLAACPALDAFAGDRSVEYLADKLRRPGFLEGGAEQQKEHARRQWDHVAEESGSACLAALEEMGVKFQIVPERKEPDRNGCGMPRGVVVTRGPSGITYSPPLAVDCSFARHLGAIERVIQEEAGKQLDAPIQRVSTLGSYSCRSVRGWKERISQHALGNAIDLSGFHPKKGKAALVSRDYARRGEEAKTAQSRFLGAVFRRLWSEGEITRVLGPDWDAAHRDHFHLDRGLRGW